MCRTVPCSSSQGQPAGSESQGVPERGSRVQSRLEHGEFSMDRSVEGLGRMLLAFFSPGNPTGSLACRLQDRVDAWTFVYR